MMVTVVSFQVVQIALYTEYDALACIDDGSCATLVIQVHVTLIHQQVLILQS